MPKTVYVNNLKVMCDDFHYAFYSRLYLLIIFEYTYFIQIDLFSLRNRIRFSRFSKIFFSVM